MATFTTSMDTDNQAPRTEGDAPDQALRPLRGSVAKELVQLFKLLSDETRLQILHLLKQNEELNVRTLCKLLAQSQPSVSHHLALLRVARLIDMRRDGKHNFYRIMPARFDELIGLVVSAIPDVGTVLDGED